LIQFERDDLSPLERFDHRCEMRAMRRPSLTPAMIAAKLGVSIRQLHLVFAPTGMSVSRTMTAMRLADARRQLASSPDQERRRPRWRAASTASPCSTASSAARSG